jgi:hypothetical protein
VEILGTSSTQSKKDYLLSILLPADIKTISVMGGCPASTILTEGQGTVGRREPAARFDCPIVSIHERQLITVPAFPVTNEAFMTPLM